MKNSLNIITKNRNKIKRIILVNLGGVGDLLLATPFFREIRNMFPENRIDLLCIERSHAILNGNPYIDNIYPLSDISLKGILKNLKTIVETFYRLNRIEYDLFINMLPHARTSGAVKMFALSLIINPVLKLGLNTSGRGFFYDVSVYEEDMKQINSIDNYFKLLGIIGGKTDIRHLEINFTRIPLEDFKFYSELKKIKDKKIIGINPGASIAPKRWPKKRFAEIIEKISGILPEAVFVITGMKNEIELAEDIIRLSNCKEEQIINLCGKTSLEELVSLMNEFNCYITNDTGSMHVAAAVDIPLVAIFGPGDFRRFTPVSVSGKIKILRRDLPCAPCVRTTCDDWSCMRNIETEEVYSAVLDLMSLENV